MKTKEIIEKARLRPQIKATEAETGKAYDFPLLDFNVFVRTLLEAFGKEIIGKKENEFPMHEQRDFDKIAVRVRNNLKSKQRQKAKDIIKSLEQP